MQSNFGTGRHIRTNMHIHYSPVHLCSSGLYCPTPRVVQYSMTTPLMVAIGNKNDAMVTALLDRNVDPNIQDKVRQGAQ